MEKLPAPAIVYGLEILKLIAREDEIGFNRLQELTGINANSLTRYLITLQKLDYIVRDKDGKYRPDLGLAVLNQQLNTYPAMKRRAEPYLIQLEAEFSLVAMLFGISHRGISCLDKVTCVDNVRMHEVGSRLDTDICCSWGILYLARMSKPKIHRFMEENHPAVYERINRDRFYQAVDFTKKYGYCDDKTTSRSGIRKIAFPIFDEKGVLTGALAAASFSSVMNDQLAKNVTDRLREYAGLISQAPVNRHDVVKT